MRWKLILRVSRRATEVIGTVLQFQDLQALCRPSGARPPRRATVEAWAKKIGLPYTYDGNGGIITTVDAFNAAMGLGPAANEDRHYSADTRI